MFIFKPDQKTQKTIKKFLKTCGNSVKVPGVLVTKYLFFENFLKSAVWILQNTNRNNQTNFKVVLYLLLVNL